LQQERHTLEVLSSLSYRTGELSRYLQEIACGVSQLLSVDWSVVTLCQNGFEKVLASSINMGDGEHTYSLHGLLTGTVMQTQRPLVVEDARTFTCYGKAPEGYLAYLGVPLRTPQGAVIGTICSFHQKPRKFVDAEVRIVEMFAERAATAIDNYHLYLQQQQFNTTLEAEVAKRTEELRFAQAKLVERERLAAIGEFAATVVHEIRNPLTTVMMGLNYFKRVDLSEPAQERLSLALGEANRLEHLLREILLYAKPHQLQLTELNINEFIREMLNTVRGMPEAQRRRIEFSPALTAVKVKADKDKLKQVFINIVRNACEAVAEAHTVTWAVDTCIAPAQVCIQIHNGGEPIPPDVLSRLTEPFYTTKCSGTGLGLAIVKRIVEAHGGELFIQSTAELGTIVSVQLPALVC
jgi:signal transduction histidine kinase